MKGKDLHTDTIVAVATPAGEGGIGIVRMSGRDAISLADEVFLSRDKRKPSQFRSHTIHYGYVADRSSGHKVTRSPAEKRRLKSGEIIDEVLLTVMRAPGTYTREDVVEINCHGGMTALRKTLGLLVKSGARMAEPGEFTKRAFLNGRLDLAQAEAVLDIIRSKTDTALRAAVSQLDGELSRKISFVRSIVLDVCVEIEAEIDFPDEDIGLKTAKDWSRKIEAARERLDALAATYHDGAILRDGITAVICGRANVGKSSLMNLLLKRDRVIVTHIPGTTRDAIEELVNIRGVPIRLVDTAGIRRQKGIVEKAGIDKSRHYLSGADLILCVLDGSEKLKEDDRKLLKSIGGKRAVVIINKCDLKRALDIKEVKRTAGDTSVIKISCLMREGIDSLEEEVYNKVWSGNVQSTHRFLLNNLRHKNAVDKAIDCLSRAAGAIKKQLPPELISIEMRECLVVLGEISGEVYNDDILNIIFSRFCVGK